MAHDLDACFWIQDVPAIEFREGQFFVCYDIGKQARFEVVMSPNTYLKALRRANQAADEFHTGKVVVPIRQKSAKPGH